MAGEKEDEEDDHEDDDGDEDDDNDEILTQAKADKRLKLTFLLVISQWTLLCSIAPDDHKYLEPLLSTMLSIIIKTTLTSIMAIAMMDRFGQVKDRD